MQTHKDTIINNHPLSLSDRTILSRIIQYARGWENYQLTLKHIHAKTRDGDLGIRIVCLFAEATGRLFFDPGCERDLPTALQPYDHKFERELSYNEITISQPGIIEAIMAEADDLKDYYPARKNQKFPKFTNGMAHIGGFNMQFSSELGLINLKGGNQDASV